jgi:hypothetical protein
MAQVSDGRMAFLMEVSWLSEVRPDKNWVSDQNVT